MMGKEDISKPDYVSQKASDSEKVLSSAKEKNLRISADLKASRKYSFDAARNVLKSAFSARKRKALFSGFLSSWLHALSLAGLARVFPRLDWIAFAGLGCLWLGLPYFVLLPFPSLHLAFAVYIPLAIFSGVIEGFAKSQQERNALSWFSRLENRLMLISHVGKPGEPCQCVVFPGLDKSRYASLSMTFPKNFRLTTGCGYLVLTEEKSLSPICGVQVSDEDASDEISFLSDAYWQNVLSKVMLSIKGDLSRSMSDVLKYGRLMLEAEKTEKEIGLLERRVNSFRKLEEDWSKVALKKETIEKIVKLVDMFVAGGDLASKGLLMYGPPGTGKTLIAKTVAQNSGCEFMSVSLSSLKGEFVGQTTPKVDALWEKARSKSPCVIFIDECESVFMKRGERKSDAFTDELVAAFLSNWDGVSSSSGKVFVMAATNRMNDLDSAIISRFSVSLEIPLPDAECRGKMLSLEFAKGGAKISDLDSWVSETNGLSGRDIHQLAVNVISETLGESPSLSVGRKFISEMRVKGKSKRAASVSWDDIVLPRSIKEEFSSLSGELANAEKLRSMNINPPKSALLYGPPGTGKTQIARILANTLGVSFVSSSLADMKQSFIGQSGQTVASIFSEAREKAPCILFIDEIEALAASRASVQSDSMTREIVGQMLQEMDGVHESSGDVFVLAATNHLEMIDKAILSRFAKKIHVPLPDGESRGKIVRKYLSDKPLSFSLDEKIPDFIEMTDGMSGRDIVSSLEAGIHKSVRRGLSGGTLDDGFEISFEDLKGGFTSS